MSTTCTFSAQAEPSCPASATHRVVRDLEARAWTVEPGALGSVWRNGQAQAVGGPGTRAIGFQAPEFCLQHAEAVCYQRNAPKGTSKERV